MTSSQPVKRKQARDNNQEHNAKSGHMKQTMEICKTAAGKLPPKPTQSVSSVCLGLFAETQKESRHTNVSYRHCRCQDSQAGVNFL